MTVLSRLAAHLTGRNLVPESEKLADDSASLPLPPIPLPEFATAEWLAERIDVTPRSLRHIHDQRRTLMESVGLESWPEKLETASDFADLFMRGFPCTADFTERCGKAAARQYERGTKKGKKVRFFERAIRMHWIKGMALANKKAKDKESLDPEVLLKDLAEGGHGQEASELAFLSLAEGGYDRGTAAAIKSNAPAFAPIMPTVRGMELHERRERLEGEGYGDSEIAAISAWRESAAELIMAAKESEPSREATIGAARALSGSAAALADWEHACAVPRSSRGAINKLRRAAELLAPIARADANLKDDSARMQKSLETAAAAGVKRDFASRLDEESEELLTDAGRAQTKLDDATEKMKSGDINALPQVQAMQKEAAEIAAATMKKIADLADEIQKAETVPSPRESSVIRAEIFGEIAAALNLSPLAVVAAPSAAAEKKESKREESTGESDSGAIYLQTAAAKISAQMSANRKDHFKEAIKLADAAIQIFGADSIPFSLDEFKFADAVEDILGDFGEPNSDRKDEAETFANKAAENIDGLNKQSDDIAVARKLWLLSASLAWKDMGAESAAGRIIFGVTVDHEFDDKFRPFAAALGESIHGGAFAERRESASPEQRADAVRDSLLEKIDAFGNMHFNFTLGQKVVPAMTAPDGEIGRLGALIKKGGRLAVSAAQDFARGYGRHSDANRLIQQVAKRVPSTAESIEGSALRKLTSAIEEIAKFCEKYAEAEESRDEPGADERFFRLKRKMARTVQFAEEALEGLHERRGGDIINGASAMMKARLQKLAQGHDSQDEQQN